MPFINYNKIPIKYIGQPSPKNPYLIGCLETNLDKIDWNYLSVNPGAISFIRKNQDKIDWYLIFSNPAIFEIDYPVLKQRIEPFKEDLIAKCFYPDRLVHYLENYNYDIGENTYFSEED